MRAIDRNGVKWNIKPKNWWNINQWFWCLDQKEAVQSQALPRGEKHNFTYGSIEELQ